MMSVLHWVLITRSGLIEMCAKTKLDYHSRNTIKGTDMGTKYQ